jgi:hypothetical protein
MIERPKSTGTVPTNLTRAQADTLHTIASKLQLVAAGNGAFEPHEAKELWERINSDFSFYDIERIAYPEGDE